jgi:hypothetical protein
MCDDSKDQESQGLQGKSTISERISGNSIETRLLSTTQPGMLPSLIFRRYLRLHVDWEFHRMGHAN